MRIAFVTGGLEPGRDGVGDYVRSLAAACAARRHEVGLLSLAEKTPAEAGAREVWPVLRLSRSQWLGDEGAAARRWLDEFRPDWVSLHFVPYGFEARGLFGGAIAPLAHTLGGTTRREIFFHELWIGSHVGATVKERAIGWGQRRAVRRLLDELAPQRVHTSVTYYRAALAAIGQPAAVLPMFGSVPRVAAARGGFPGVAEDALVCGHFGTLHPDWTAAEFLREFATLAEGLRRPAALVAVGGLGYGAALFEELKAAWRGRIRFLALGRMVPEELSRAFADFDFAVTSVPWNIRGKSSSAAALREHGLQVVVTAPGSPPRFTREPVLDPEAEEGFIPFFKAPDGLVCALEKTPPRAGVDAVAQRFLADFDESI